MSVRVRLGLLALALSLQVATVPVAAQSTLEARPATVTLLPDGQAEVVVYGSRLPAFSEGVVVDERGRQATGLWAKLGRNDGQRLGVTLVTRGAQPGRYRLILAGGRTRAEVRLAIGVEAPPEPRAEPPTAVAIVEPTEFGRYPVLDARRSAPAAGRTIAAYLWTPLGSGLLSEPVKTDEPTFDTRRASPGPPRPGRHPVRLVVVDDLGRESQPVEVAVEVRDTQAPTAVLDAPAEVTDVAEVALDASRSSDVAPGAIADYRWTLVAGAGATSMALNVEVRTDEPTLALASTAGGALAAGLYRLRLVVVDEAGNTSTPTEAQIQVQASVAPTAVVDAEDVELGSYPVLDASRSIAGPGRTLVEYRWTPLDGLFSAPVQTAEPVFDVATRGEGLPGVGRYGVRLTAIDDLGRESQPVEVAVEVRDTQAPTAVLDAPAVVTDVAEVALDASRSSDVAPGAIADYRWTLVAGAGATSMALNVEVRTDEPTLGLASTTGGALAAGLYRLRLVVVDEAGNTSTPTEAQVQVQASVAPVVPAHIELVGGPRLRGEGTVRVHIAEPAPPGGAPVEVRLEPAALLDHPVAVTVPPGETRVDLPVSVPAPPTDTILEGRLEASAGGGTVERAGLEVWPMEPWVASLEVWNPRAAYVSGHEVTLRYDIGGVTSADSYRTMVLESSGPGSVEADPAALTPTQQSGLLEVQVDDVSGDGDMTITLRHAEGARSVAIPVTRPSLRAITVVDDLQGSQTPVAEAHRMMNVACVLDWELAAGLGPADLPLDYADTVSLSADRPDLFQVPSEVVIRRTASDETASYLTQCRVAEGVLAPADVTVSAVLHGQTQATTFRVVPVPASIVDFSALPPSGTGPVVLGSPFVVRLRTDLPAEGGTVRLSSSEPGLLAVPDEVAFDAADAYNVTAEVIPPVPAAMSPPLPRDVTLTAELGCSVATTVVSVRPPVLLEGAAVTNLLHPRLYPGEPFTLLLDVDAAPLAPTGDYAVEFSTSRPEVFATFPEAWSPDGSAPTVQGTMATFQSTGTVDVRVFDGTVEHTVTLELDKPALEAVAFTLTSAQDASGTNRSVAWGTEVERIEAGSVFSSVDAPPAATVQLGCRPSFTLRAPLDPWSEPVQLTSSRPDLLTVPAEVEVTFRGQGSGGVAEGAATCEADLTTLTQPELVEVTATYGSESVTSTLELVPAQPPLSAIAIQPDPTFSDRLLPGESATLRVEFGGLAPLGSTLELSGEWANQNDFIGPDPDPLEILGMPASVDVGGADFAEIGLAVSEFEEITAGRIEATLSARLGGDVLEHEVWMGPRAWVTSVSVAYLDELGERRLGAFAGAPGSEVFFTFAFGEGGATPPGVVDGISVDDRDGLFATPPSTIPATRQSQPLRIGDDVAPGFYTVAFTLGGITRYASVRVQEE